MVPESCCAEKKKERYRFYIHVILCSNIICWQQAGGAIAMDADATAVLHKKGVAATDDTFKFIWFKVCY